MRDLTVVDSENRGEDNELELNEVTGRRFCREVERPWHM